jgi:hypothetical protein
MLGAAMPLAFGHRRWQTENCGLMLGAEMPLAFGHSPLAD